MVERCGDQLRIFKSISDRRDQINVGKPGA